jgi:hypothetical protein
MIYMWFCISVCCNAFITCNSLSNVPILVYIFKESWRCWRLFESTTVLQLLLLYLPWHLLTLGLKQVYTHLEGMRPHAVNTSWAMLSLIAAGQVYLFVLRCGWWIYWYNVHISRSRIIYFNSLIVTGWKRSNTTASGS